MPLKFEANDLVSARVTVADNAWTPITDVTRAQFTPHDGDQRSSIVPTCLAPFMTGAVRMVRPSLSHPVSSGF